jgi:uncharacterized membrane protein YidH (DUF202 family)
MSALLFLFQGCNICKFITMFYYKVNVLTTNVINYNNKVINVFLVLILVALLVFAALTNNHQYAVVNCYNIYHVDSRRMM